ncbi:MAG: relaxase/mobilization nuclease domain-containing protein [Cyclobacteriaceae bacterium]|nr:relaxase/mobilization nuclease domain-containing protein [Cyclobacteriaceae bacterium]
MTGNQIKGKGFRGALRYNLEKVDRGIAEVLDHSFVSVSEKSIMKEVQMVRVQRPNLQKYFYHTSINFPPCEDLANERMKQIGHDYMVANGFTQHQFIMFRHHDADHPHLHILVNRIGYDGKVLSDSNDFARSEKVLRELEIRYGLTKVNSSSQARERAMTKNELEMMKRTNEPSQKMKLQVLIRGILQEKQVITTREFIKALECKGINVLFNQASTGFVSGISYGFEGIIIKGVKLGNDFKWSTIKGRINYEQERDRTTIHQANDRTKSINPDAGTGDGHSSRDSKTVRQGRAKQQPLFKRPEGTEFHDARSSKQSSDARQPARSTEREDDSSINIVPKKSKGLDLAALLDGHSHGNTFHADHQPDMDFEKLKSKKRKRKRRGRL